jgi:hypothetical protein
MSLIRLGLLSLLSATLLAGCDDEDEVLPTAHAAEVPESRGALDFTANGGDGMGGPTSRGGGGGTIVAICRGNGLIGQNPAPLAPPLPSTPVAGYAIGSWSNALTIPAGNAILNGTVSASTSDTSVTLTVAEGDLVINGTLNILGQASLDIYVPGGTVFIHGTIRTGRTDSAANGENGGNLNITALRVIFTGTIDTRGEDNASGNGGWGGSVTFCTDGDTIAQGTGQTSQMFVGGTIDMSGGSAAGSEVSGGVGGNFQTSRHLFLPNNGGHYSGAADGAVYLSGTTLNVNGGSASGTGKVRGGSAGYMYWMGDSGFFFDGMATGIGGHATSSNGDARGGSGCALFVNEFTIGDSGPVAIFGTIDLSAGSATSGPSKKAEGGTSGFAYLINGTDMNFGRGVWSLRGGASSGKGGEGGGVSIDVPDGIPGEILVDSSIDLSCGDGAGEHTVSIGGALRLHTSSGDIQIAGSVRANGGRGSVAGAGKGPSSGGRFEARTGATGSIRLRGSLQANGGSDGNAADSTNGAAGGTVDFTCGNPWGSITLEPGSLIELHGGNGNGSGIGGAGGTVALHTNGGSGGHVLLRGAIAARGGNGAGLGGFVLVESDTDKDGWAGSITLDGGATIDVGGGEGGGSGRNNSVDGASAPVCVYFDADGNNSNHPVRNGIVRNLGAIVSRGTSPGGDGGDVRFDGLDENRTVGADPGSLELSGTEEGGFLSE